MNKVKDKIQKGIPSIGSWLQLPHETTAEIMAQGHYDWLAIDLEHGHFSIGCLAGIIRCLENYGVVPIVRLPSTQREHIKWALDAGARGLIFPMIDSAEQLQNAIQESLYPPLGRRGVGFSRANHFGGKLGVYLEDMEDDILFVAQIESAKAVDDIDAICRTPNLDAVLIGPYDLSASLGITAQFNDERFTDALHKVEENCRNYSIGLGIHIVEPDESELRDRVSAGYRFIAYSIDSVFLRTSCHNPLHLE